MPNTDRKLRVFLCHASQDKPIVRDLYERLLAEGWIDPWLDEDKLLPGQDWNMEIDKAVEAANAVIVCISNNSVSKEGYAQKELRKVLDIALEKPEGKIFVIPLRLEECTPPRRLLGWHYADYFPAERRHWVFQRLQQSLKLLFDQTFVIGEDEETEQELIKPNSNEELHIISKSFTDVFREVFEKPKTDTSSAINNKQNNYIYVPLTLSFDEAAFGVEKPIEFQREEICLNCGGTGDKVGSSPIRCATCYGRGEIRQVRQTFLGQMVQSAKCPNCNGSGKIFLQPCTNCQSKGICLSNVKRRFVVPAGVDTGTKIRLAGEGHIRKTGEQSGDVFIVMTVEPHPFFIRDQANVVVRYPIPMWLALHGGSLQVPLLKKGKYKELSIPANTPNQQKFRMLGFGIPKLESGSGDLFVIVEIYEKEKSQQIKKMLALINKHMKN